MKLIHNTFNKQREVSGFSKDELLTIKRRVSEFRSGKLEESELKDLLLNKFPENILEDHIKYIEHIEIFINFYIPKITDSKSDEQFNYYFLRSGLLEELELISNNLLNLKLNCQNSKRFLKDNYYLNNYIEKLGNALEKSKKLQGLLKPIDKPPLKYEDLSKIWLKTNKIKNLLYLMKNPENNLELWDEIRDIYNYLKGKGDKQKKGGIFNKKEEAITFEFSILNNYIPTSFSENPNFYRELCYNLYKNNFLTEFEEQEFSNILERKEIKNELRSYLRSVIKDLIMIKLNKFIQEIKSFKKESKYEKENIQMNLEALKNDKIKNFLPILVDLYFIGLENYYQSVITNIKDLQKFNEIIEKYSSKIDTLYSKIEEIKDFSSNYENFLKPYEEMLISLNKIYSGLLQDIYRRKEEYIYHLEAIKKEKMKDDIRGFTSEKIEELNNLIEKYRDEVAVLLKKKLPQLEEIENIISTYKSQINKIKDDMYQKLKEHEDKDLDQYQIIKKWEENYKRRKEQIGFLLSQYLTNLYKDFEGLIEKEEALFDRIKDITKYGNQQEELPLNYAFSSFLSDKLTEDELRERMFELKAKLNKLNHLEMLYQDELSQLEESLKTRVRIREGISTSNVQCGVCRKEINFAKDKIVKCPFCGAVYHYLCVAFWLSKYNSCPSCQNAFLDPNQNIYEAQSEE